ncbi:lipopolysaccharide biosynthesis protein [Terriglobus sp.]|uniref:lipopolysaccharide biosynthesis protein n=1 Tax=Terriglobus sp. TaxID=1889013 RepID=UPI003B003E86
MSLRRLLQILLTGFVGQGLTVLSQLLVPPFFFKFYPSGIEVYGEWLALSAAVNYLGTLNYGIQSYASNQITILYNGGDVPGARTVQASALRLLLLIASFFAIAGLIVFVLPVAGWLRLRHVGPGAAAITLYLLILQISSNMFLSLLTNSYMAVGLLHRGNYISSAQRLLMILSMATAIYFRASFPTLAALQLASYVIFFGFALVDLRRIAPALVPRLSDGSWSTVRTILKPSGHFGLISVAGFLTWQGPILVIVRVMGPATVALFGVVRVVFQMSRQLLSMASSVFAQDITLMVGRQDWPRLRRLYDLSERLVLFLIPVVSIGSLLLCPLLFTVWLHKPHLYQPELCFLMAIVSAVLGLKEHKTQFQSSSNEHEELSTFILIGYSIMLGVSVPVMHRFGLPGFILTWLVWEIIQTAGVVRLNTRLFPAEHRFGKHLLWRFCGFIVAAFAAVAWPALREAHWSLPFGVASACLISCLLAAAAWPTFQMTELLRVLRERIHRRRLRSADAAS